MNALNFPLTADDEARSLATLPPPSLEALSMILRDRTMWPEGFEWDYGYCAHCAMALSAALWEQVHILQPEGPWFFAFCVGMGISGDTVDIFLGAAHVLQRKSETITPEDIADLIDAYLAEETGV